MKRKTLVALGLVALLAIGFAGTAFANEAVANVLRNRFGCADIPGEAITVSGTVTGHEWNGFELTTTDGTVYLVKTGPARIGRNMEQIPDNTTATVEGYTGAGTNQRAEVADGVNILRAKTITVGETVYDLTQLPAGGYGQGGRNMGRQGQGGQTAHGMGRGGNGGNGTGVCPR